MSFFTRLLQAIPFECAICKRWPSSSFEGASSNSIKISGVCQSCVQKHAKAPVFPAPQGLDDCIAAVDFDSPWSALIARYKFAPEPGLARLFAGLMLRDERVRELLSCADIVLPLPLSPERLEQRGFNQALALAKHLCARPLSPTLSHEGRGGLIRTRDTAPQRTLDREARQRNVENAFALLGAKPHYASLQDTTSLAYSSADSHIRASFAGKHILLVDDVMTTGATLAAAAEPLRRAGAARVSAVVIARTPLHSPPPHPSLP